jgi:hypothetical protein
MESWGDDPRNRQLDFFFACRVSGNSPFVKVSGRAEENFPCGVISCERSLSVHDTLGLLPFYPSTTRTETVHTFFGKAASGVRLGDRSLRDTSSLTDNQRKLANHRPLMGRCNDEAQTV